ncbi:MAG: exonuclease SbcCD subunit D C-terminal domain-containing protein, partial [Acidimicrobiia bacterium]|nr:exonuclease SbcCD subunit D C-terminal domain-containing protein [Acidimicrobiia bacterium]
APLLQLGRITMATEPRSPSDGGLVAMDAGGVGVDIALVPFVSQRGMVRAAQLMANAAFENAQTYADRMGRILDALCAGFSGDRVNLIVGHLFVPGGDAGGGERQAHLADEYGVSTVDFPPTVQYVALGHLHRPQQMLGATAIHYSGSPLQLDFGESQEAKQVNIVDLEPGLPAKVRPRMLEAGKPLRTVRGTLTDVVAHAATIDEADKANTWFRVRLRERSRSGLADEVRKALGAGVVDVRVETDEQSAPKRSTRAQRSPRDLFADYLAERGVDDPAVEKRFIELYDQQMEHDR